MLNRSPNEWVSHNILTDCGGEGHVEGRCLCLFPSTKDAHLTEAPQHILNQSPPVVMLENIHVANFQMFGQIGLNYASEREKKNYASGKAKRRACSFLLQNKIDVCIVFTGKYILVRNQKLLV